MAITDLEVRTVLRSIRGRIHTDLLVTCLFNIIISLGNLHYRKEGEKVFNTPLTEVFPQHDLLEFTIGEIAA